MCVCSVANACPNYSNSWTVAHRAPKSIKFSRQEYWSRLLFPIPKDFPYPEIQPSCITYALNTDNNNKQIRLTSYQKYWKPNSKRTYVLLKKIIIS